MMGIGSTHVVAFLISAVCKFLEFRNNHIIASLTTTERTHIIIDFFSSVNT